MLNVLAHTFKKVEYAKEVKDGLCTDRLDTKIIVRKLDKVNL